ncbi:MAG: hypothetical protein ACOX0H_01520 [Patescibacteria group bacterium]|jgi:DNA-binding Lrp family transcriptional regulator|nr:hypothetical protein [bacterium]HQC49614.1 hypothetical protein [bacterium]
MLSTLFGSEPRVKILNLLLLNPEKKYLVKEIGKETTIPAASVRKELNRLLEFGVIKEEGELWSINQDFIIFPELKALVAKAQILYSQKFIDGLKKVSEPKFLALTGVFTGDALVKTDILLVGPVKRRAFVKLVGQLEKDLAREINYTLMDEGEFFFRQEVMDIFLYNILTGKTIVLVNHWKDEIQPEIKRIARTKENNNSDENENY